MDLMREFSWIKRSIESTTTTNDQSKEDKNFTNFEKLFKTNRTVKDTEIKLQMKPGYSPVKHKARRLPYHLFSYVEKDMKKLIQPGHLQKNTNGRRGLFCISCSNNREESQTSKICICYKKDN